MHAILSEQYKSIHETIRANAQTIGSLIQQAERLKKLADKLTDERVKASMTQHVAEIESTIQLLIQQSDDLFEKYNQFVEQLFQSK